MTQKSFLDFSFLTKMIDKYEGCALRSGIITKRTTEVDTNSLTSRRLFLFCVQIFFALFVLNQRKKLFNMATLTRRL